MVLLPQKSSTQANCTELNGKDEIFESEKLFFSYVSFLTIITRFSVRKY